MQQLSIIHVTKLSIFIHQALYRQLRSLGPSWAVTFARRIRQSAVPSPRLEGPEKQSTWVSTTAVKQDNTKCSQEPIEKEQHVQLTLKDEQEKQSTRWAGYKMRDSNNAQ